MVKIWRRKIKQIRTNIFQNSYQGGKIPREWTALYISSLHEMGEKYNCNNIYGDFSVIPWFARIFKKVVKTEIQENISDEIGEV